MSHLIKWRAIALSITLFLPALAMAGEAKEQDRLERTLTFSNPSGPKKLTVDNVFGGIEVTAHSENSLVAVVRKTIVADNDQKLQTAKVEVSLVISEKDNHLVFYVDSPFRDRDGNWRQNDDPGYRVQYDFQLRAPARLALVLKTVINGDIRVEDISGHFEINNVNGKIDLVNVAGDGEALTVNGSVNAHFVEAPQADLKLRTVNGDLDISFPPELSADLKVKTFNGEVYASFEVAGLPGDAPIHEMKKGLNRYKSDSFTNLRVAGGGPLITFETLNGDILIRKK